MVEGDAMSDHDYSKIMQEENNITIDQAVSEEMCTDIDFGCSSEEISYLKKVNATLKDEVFTCYQFIKDRNLLSEYEMFRDNILREGIKKLHEPSNWSVRFTGGQEQRKKTQGIHFGIDLGTTNTVIASCKQGKRFLLPITREINQEILPGQQGRRKSLPSILYIDKDDKVHVGECAKNRVTDGASINLLYNTKNDMGARIIYDNGFTPVKAAAEILKVCYENIRTYVGLNTEILSVTITVPASFTQDQVVDTIEAAKIAGFDLDKISILEEPIASLYYYINRQLISGDEDIIDFSETKRVLIYDIGGSACDVCILDFKVNDNYDFDVHFILNNRYTESGGDAFDEQAAIGLLNKIFKRYDIKDSDVDLDDIKKNIIPLFIPFCEQYRLQYSELIRTAISDERLPDPSVIQDASFGSLKLFLSKYENVKLDISYEEYQKFTKIFFEDNYTHPSKNLTNKTSNKSIIDPVYQLIKKYGKNGERPIDCVFLTGGMSKYLPIKYALKEFCKCPVIDIQEPTEAVALGASMFKFTTLNYI